MRRIIDGRCDSDSGRCFAPARRCVACARFVDNGVLESENRVSRCSSRAGWRPPFEWRVVESGWLDQQPTDWLIAVGTVALDPFRGYADGVRQHLAQQAGSVAVDSADHIAGVPRRVGVQERVSSKPAPFNAKSSRIEASRSNSQTT
jgi:hypothetical protein